MTRAEDRQFHYIYKTTRHDGRYYIGMHSTDVMVDGYLGSGHLLARSIRKHGRDKHLKEVLEFLPSRKELAAREKALIDQELLGDPLCMNLSTGGTGGYALKNRTNGFHRAGYEAMARAKDLSVAAKKTWSSHREKMLVATTKTLETARTSAHTDGATAKRKQTFAESGHAQGSKNSQFGTCWVVKDGAAMKIKADLLGAFLTNGYTKGRK